MSSELTHIKDFIQPIAEVIATVIKLEIQVFDPERNFVAGTGYVREQVGVQYKGRLTGQLIETGNTIIARSPGHCQECFNCTKFGTCIYHSVIAFPLQINDKVLGSFCLVAMTEEQEQLVLNNEKSLFSFLDRICPLIVSVVNERIVKRELSVLWERYYNVANTVHEGIIAADTSGKIIDINLSAAKLLDVKAEQVLNKKIISLFPDFKIPLVDENPLESELYYRTETGKMHFMATVAPVFDVNKHKNQEVIISLRNLSMIQLYPAKLADNCSKYVFDDIKSKSQTIIEIKEKLKKAAQTDSNILICGESGTGKEMFAHAIHSASKRSNKSLITVNCSAIPEALLESELFGYEEGAFTGARKGGKPGKFELANGGTIFLDEIGEMPLYHQSKLLRVLEDRVIERVGGTELIAVDVRIVAATNKPIEQMVENHEFRSDLYYRLNVIPALIPPLRERTEDIELLINYFLKKYTIKFNRPEQSLDNCAKELLLNYLWPGNIRELQNTIEYAINMSEPGQVISIEHLPHRIYSNYININKTKKTQYKKSLKEMKLQAIREALTQFGNTTEGRKRAAAYLGISLSTIKRHLKELY